MTPTKRNRSGGRKTRAPRASDLTPIEAREVLRRLSRKRSAVGESAREAIRDYVLGFDADDIAAGVFDELDGIMVEDLLERSGPSAHGYTDPADESWMMIEEVLRPYVDRIAQYQRWEMGEEAGQYCLAVLDGIHRYDQESRSDFKKWAPDDAAEAFVWVRHEWKDGTSAPMVRKHQEDVLARRFPEWA